MPELPEVEIQLQYIRRFGIGKRMTKVRVLENRIIKCPDNSERGSRCGARFARLVRGKRMVDATRRGKYLIVALDDGSALILHFGMGGELAYYRRAEERPRFTRIEFELSDGGRIAFTCPRNICRVMVVREPSQVSHIREMGPEPLGSGFTLGLMKSAIERSRRRQVKPLLMDQRTVAGVGNIYADEILFISRIRPNRLAATLTDNETRRIVSATKRVLSRAIETAAGANFPPGFLLSRSLLNMGCARCNGPITTMRIAGRTSRFCPKCQS
jgi:formamidopyrimidine-DNA glycosylase